MADQYLYLWLWDKIVSKETTDEAIDWVLGAGRDTANALINTEGWENTGHPLVEWLETYFDFDEESPQGVEMVTNKQNKLKPKKLSFDNLPSDDDAEDEEEEYMMVGRRIHGNSMIGKAGGPRKAGAQTFAEDDEAPVVPPPAKVSKIINDYFTIQLPLHYDTRFALAYPGSAIAGGIINLNTINTPIIGSTHDFRGRDTWASLFQYYRVLQTDIRFTWFGANANTLVGWSLHEDTSHSSWTTRRDMCEAKNGGFDLLEAHEADGTITPAFNTYSGTRTRLVQQYTYKPESWDHHV